MSEEIFDASIIVPRTMMTGVILNGTLGFAMLIAVLYCAGDLTVALDSPTGYPYMEILRQGTGSPGGANGLIIIIIVVCILGSISFVAVASRLVWAYARDRAVPGWRVLSKACHLDRYCGLPTKADTPSGRSPNASANLGCCRLLRHRLSFGSDQHRFCCRVQRSVMSIRTHCSCSH